MKTVQTGIFFSIALLFTNAVFAKDNACLLEADFMFGTERVIIKDCIHNKSMPVDAFKSYCDGLSKAGESLGAPPAKITYMEACPLPSQGSCDVSVHQPMTNYYYKREVDALPELKESCEAWGGVWKSQ